MATATLESMTTDEVANWIMTLSGSDIWKKKIVAEVRENYITGQDLAGMESRYELCDFGIPKLFAFKLWKGIQAKRAENEKGATIQDKMAEMRKPIAKQRAKAASEEKESVSSTAFTIPIVVGKIQKRTRVMFEPRDTVFKLKQAIVDEEGGEIRNLHLICRGKPLSDDINKTLEESGINGLQPVVAIFRVIGGGGPVPGIYTVHINESHGEWQWTPSGEIKYDGNDFKGTVSYDNAEYDPFNGKFDEQGKCTFKYKFNGSSWYEYKCDLKQVDGSDGFEFVGLWKNSWADSFPSSHTVVLKLVKKA